MDKITLYTLIFCNIIFILAMAYETVGLFRESKETQPAILKKAIKDVFSQES